MDELAEIKRILDERLWFIHLPLVERVRKLTTEYLELQAEEGRLQDCIMDLDGAVDDLREENYDLRDEIREIRSYGDDE